MNLSYLIDYVRSLPLVMALLGMAVGFVVILWFMRNASTPQEDHAVLRAGNLAVAIDRAGYLLGHVVALSFALLEINDGPMINVVAMFALKCCLITIVLFILSYVVDWAVLPKVNNNTELLAGNTAVATAMAFVYVALGCVVGAATVGSATNVATWIASFVVFALLGVALLIAVTRLHVVVTHRSYDLRAELLRKNVVPALDVGSLVLSLAILISVAVAGDLTSWIEGLEAFFATSAVGLLVLYATQWLVNRMLTQGRSASSVRNDQDIAMMALICAGRLALALIVWALVKTVI